MQNIRTKTELDLLDALDALSGMVARLRPSVYSEMLADWQSGPVRRGTTGINDPMMAAIRAIENATKS